MVIEQIYTGCLAQGAYYIESDGQAAIIDPLREVKPYLIRAEKSGATIKYILETHFHADFVSGHLDLADQTAAQIVYGPNAKPAFPFYAAKDGEELKLGNASIKVLHTPGHTMESTCYLLKDEHGKEVALFSGDTLFIGDVGRPDLAQKIVKDLTPELLAGYLFDSLRNKIMPLPDDVMVYPAHGAGSACGKNMSKENVDTLGNQKKTNYALRANMTKAEFIAEVTAGLLPPPGYFPSNVLMNINGYDRINEVLKRAKHALKPADFEALANETSALVLDTRNPEVFVKGFIPNSINIGIDGDFAPWVGTMIADIKQQILLVAEPGREEEVVTRLARVGYDFTIGYLDGGFEAWKAAGKAVEKIVNITANELASILNIGKLNVIDVRRPGEYQSEHVQNAKNIPLEYLNDHFAELRQDETYIIHCAAGYRSVIFASILKARGFQNLINVTGGFAAIKKVNSIAITNFTCPSSLPKAI